MRVFFNKRTILLNKRFYWKIVTWENEQNTWKLNNNFKNEQNLLKKRTKLFVNARWTNFLKSFKNFQIWILKILFTPGNLFNSAGSNSDSNLNKDLLLFMFLLFAISTILIILFTSLCFFIIVIVIVTLFSF